MAQLGLLNVQVCTKQEEENVFFSYQDYKDYLKHILQGEKDFLETPGQPHEFLMVERICNQFWLKCVLLNVSGTWQGWKRKE